MENWDKTLQKCTNLCFYTRTDDSETPKSLIPKGLLALTFQYRSFRFFLAVNATAMTAGSVGACYLPHLYRRRRVMNAPSALFLFAINHLLCVPQKCVFLPLIKKRQSQPGWHDAFCRLRILTICSLRGGVNSHMSFFTWKQDITISNVVWTKGQFCIV